MIEIQAHGIVRGSFLVLALLSPFWATDVSASPEDRDEICQGYKRTALWGQCTRAVVNGCDESEVAHPRCEQWAQIWRDQTGVEPPWLLICGGSQSKCVFVTSGTFIGNLIAEATSLTGQTPSNGLEAGDQICQFVAESDGSLAAPGTYRAWLSALNGSPNTRFTRSTVPYELVDGTLVANDYADLIDGSPLASTISVTELGSVSATFVWTGTWISGDLPAPISCSSPTPTSSPCTCEGWSTDNPAFVGFFGSAFTTDSWTAYNATFCNQTESLYCFQQ